MSVYPNLIVIGAMKSGTTSLHRYLSLHPAIHMSEKKELDFFVHSVNFSRGTDWYLKHFDPSKPITGETSPSYSKTHVCPEVPENIYQFNPDVKLIYMVRDPIQRLVSHFYEAQEQGRATKTIDDFLLNYREDNRVASSRYFMQLQAYLKYFPLQQIKVICAEELKKERLRVMNEIFAFLEVEPMHNPEVFSFKANTVNDKYRRSEVGKILRQINKRVLSTMFSEESRERIRNTPLVKKLIERPIQTSAISPLLVAELKEYFREDVEALRELTGQSFAEWSV
ncbi:MAG: sulfotransferase domain-containing protein [Bacteroidota bacterium]